MTDPSDWKTRQIPMKTIKLLIYSNYNYKPA